MDKTKIAAGSLICFESGEYSDREVLGFLVALVDFDIEAEHALFRRKLDEQWGHGNEFLPFLFAKGYLMDVNYRRAHIGSYGDAELDIH